MSLKERYERRKKQILNDSSIIDANRKLFKKFFEWEEKKLRLILKRKYKINDLDEKSYKTLNIFIYYFYNINKWFKNKDWKKITKKEIKQVYEDLETGIIKKSNGEPYQDTASFYNKVFKSKPFQLAGKKDISKEVIEYIALADEEVKYIDFEDIKKIFIIIPQPLRYWLTYDTTENLGTILLLQKKNCTKQTNKENGEPEYIINLPRSKIKRSRTTRSILTNFKETTQLLDIALKDLKDEDYLFTTGLRQAEKDFKKAVLKTGIKCKPNGETPTPKDLISSSVCNLLWLGWNIDEIKARKGHKPSSTAIDKYANYQAISSSKPKVKIYQNNLDKIQQEMERVKHQEKLKDIRLENQKEEIEQNKNKLEEMEKMISMNSRNNFLEIIKNSKYKDSKEMKKMMLNIAEDIKKEVEVMAV